MDINDAEKFVNARASGNEAAMAESIEMVEKFLCRDGVVERLGPRQANHFDTFNDQFRRVSAFLAPPCCAARQDAALR